MDRNKTILVLGFLLLAVTAWAFYYFLTHTGEETPSPPPPSFDTEARSPFISRFVSQIVFDPDKPGVLYVAVVEQGIFRSPDKGKNWVHLSADFQNLMIYQLMLNPRDSDHLYAGTYGSGVFQSLDGGSSWSATNTGLTNTSVEALSFHPHEADILYLATTGGGFFKSLDGGKTWFAYNEGLPDWDHNHTQTFLAFKKTGELLFGNYQGLFLRQEADPRSKNSSPPWTRVEIAPDDAAVTFFFKDPVSNRFYLSTRKGNFYSSGDGKKWEYAGDQLKKFAVYGIHADPQKPGHLFNAGGLNGIVESSDNGATWKPTRVPPPDHDVRVLVRDPQDPSMLWIGTRKEGLWTSVDGGVEWRQEESLPYLDWATLLEGSDAHEGRSGNEGAGEEKTGPPPGVPPAMAKCNTCHGWTEPDLNTNLHTFWYVTPTPRNWEITVNRMAERSNLGPGEDEDLIRYMNEHYGE